MTQAPLVSALIVSHRPAFLASAIAMMRAQNYRRIELVVSLHGVTQSELPALGRADRVLEMPASMPLGSCLNLATAAARGDVLA
jgi:hypothetical protein